MYYSAWAETQFYYVIIYIRHISLKKYNQIVINNALVGNAKHKELKTSLVTTSVTPMKFPSV